MKNQYRTHRKAITLYLAKPLLPNLESVTVPQRSNFKCDANNDEEKCLDLTSWMVMILAKHSVEEERW